MRRINYKSDFDFLLKLRMFVRNDDGTCTLQDVGFPEYDWEAVFWTSRRSTSFTASSKGGVLTNCFNDNGQIHIVCNNRGLGAGVLQTEFHAHIPNTIYDDSCEDLYTVLPLDIELVPGQGDCMTKAEVAMIMPYIKGEKGDALTFEDLTPEQIAELQKPITDKITEADALLTQLKEATSGTNVGIYPFTGELDTLEELLSRVSADIAPVGSIWYIASEGCFLAVTEERTTTANVPHNYDCTGIPKAKTDVIFRCGTQLYRHTENGLEPIMSGGSGSVTISRIEETTIDNMMQ